MAGGKTRLVALPPARVEDHVTFLTVGFTNVFCRMPTFQIVCTYSYMHTWMMGTLSGSLTDNCCFCRSYTADDAL